MTAAAEATPAPTLDDLVDAAATILCARGHLDPEVDEWPDDVLADLTTLAGQGKCEEYCPWGGSATPYALADHWYAMKVAEYERSLPTWTCDCGAVYKVADERGVQVFYVVADDGLLGDRVGVRRNSKGHVKHTDVCKSCGRAFAVIIDRRANPQQSLF